MEQKQDSDGDLGFFVLKMNLSSDSEADLEEEREDKGVVGLKNETIDEAEVLRQHELQNDNCTNNTSTKVAKRRSDKRERVKWGLRDEIVLCSAVVDGIKCGLQGMISAADVMNVRKSEGFWDAVNKKLEEETGKCVSRWKLYYKFRDMRRRFMSKKRRPNPQLNRHDKEVARILAQAFGNSKRKKRGLSDAIHSDAKEDTADIDSLLEGKMVFPEKRSAKCMSKFHSDRHCTSCSPGSRKQDDGISLNKSSSVLRTPRQQDDGICLTNSRGYGRGMYQNEELSGKKCSVSIDVVKEQSADIGSNSKGEVGLDSSTFGSRGKRLKWDLRDDCSTFRSSGRRFKWDLRDEIVIASVVRDSVNSGLHGVSSAKHVTRFKTHQGFWDEVAEKLKQETGKCVSPWKFCTKFGTMKQKYFVGKQSHVQQLNQHDKELFGIFEQMFGNVRKQRAHHHGSSSADVKEAISGGTMFGKRKSVKPLTTAHSSHLSTGFYLRNLNKRKKPEVNWNERFLSGERTLKQDDGTCLRNNGGDGHTMYHNKEFSAKKYSEDSNEGKDAHVGSNRKEEVGLDSLKAGSGVKRLKWDLKDEIVIASFVRDGVSCGLDGVSSATDVTHFKSHKGFWDEVAEKLNKETGQCASAIKLYSKFKSIKKKYQQGHVQQLNQHDKELFGILEQMFGNDGKQRSGHHFSNVKGQVSGGATLLVDTVLSTQRNSLDPSTAAYSSHPSTGPDLRNLNEVRPALNWNERFPGDKTLRQGGGKDFFKNGGHGVCTCFSAVRSPEKDGKREEGQNEDQKSESKANMDNLVLQSAVKTVKRRPKRVNWGLRDEIVIASTVQDGINRGVHGVTSLRDVMAFSKHDKFWSEVKRKLEEEMGHYLSKDKLYQKFKNMKYKYLSIKQSDIQEFNKLDKEHFNILEQVFGHSRCVTPHSDNKRLDISGGQPFPSNEIQEKLYKQSGVLATEDEPHSDNKRLDISGGQPFPSNEIQEKLYKQSPSNEIQEKLYKQSGALATEDEPQHEHEKAIDQDGQNCNQLPFEVLSTDSACMGARIKQRNEVDSCPNVVNGSTLPVPSLSPGNPSPSEGYQTGVTFSASTACGEENHNGMKDKVHAGGKNKQLHDRIIMTQKETEQDHEQRFHDMLSKSESKSGERKGDQFFSTDDILTRSRILEDISDHQSDYAEVVKRLERKSRKLQLMQELYKIEQQEIEEHICQVKLKASSNP